MKLPGLLAVITAAAVPSAAVAGDDEPSNLRQTYEALRDGGCDVSTIGSPIVARVLRNVPYALQGKRFKSAELTYVFEQDGGWYSARDAAADVTAADRPCVRKLDAQEKKLRKRAKLKPAIEQVITRHGGAVLDMHRLVLADFKRFSQSEATRDGVRTWAIDFEEGGGAARVTITCMLPEADARAKPVVWTRLACHALAAG